MDLIINDKSVSFTDVELIERYVSEGSEGTIYEYNGDALKIYHERCLKKRLTEEEAKRLGKIETKRIMVPKDIIYDSNGRFIGYTTPFKRERKKEFFGLLKMESLINELELLKRDAKLLSEYKVLLKDLHFENLLYSYNELYLCDPGEYEFHKGSSISIYKNNIMELNYLFTRMILTNYLGLTKKQKEALCDYFEPSSDYFIDKLSLNNINPSQKVKSYFNNFTKRLIL